MKSKYQWQGEPVKVRFGYVTVVNREDKPLYWYNYECNTDGNYGEADIPAIEVTYHDQVFFIANHFGIGAHKLKHGGWPNYMHFSLFGHFKEETIPELLNGKRQLNEEKFAEHESNRRKWQKYNFPEEFEKNEHLKESMRNCIKDAYSKIH